MRTKNPIDNRVCIECGTWIGYRGGAAKYCKKCQLHVNEIRKQEKRILATKTTMHQGMRL